MSGRPHPSAGDAADPVAKKDRSCPIGDPRGGGRRGSWAGCSGGLVVAVDVAAVVAAAAAAAIGVLSVSVTSSSPSSSRGNQDMPDGCSVRRGGEKGE